MSAETTVKTRCPVCQSKYHVPAKTVGHRVRCKKCDTVFRVAKAELSHAAPSHQHPPTEADILQWLNEGNEDNDMEVRPSRNDYSADVENSKPKFNNERADRIPSDPHPAAIPSDVSGRRPLSQADMPAKELNFRKTG